MYFTVEERIYLKTTSFEYASRISYAKNPNVCLVGDKCSSYEEPHRHDYYEMVYIYEGAGVQIVNGIAYAVRPGSIILLRPDDNHSFYATEHMYQVNICFVDTSSLSNFRSNLSEVPVATLNEQSRIEMETLLYLLENELNSHQYRSDAAANDCLDWMLLILQRHTEDQPSHSPFWGRLLSYISENYATVTLQEAADIVGVSVSHFCRIFKRDFSMTFHAYVENVRMQRAKFLLSYTNNTIASISENIGYTSGPCRFYQDFKKIVGKTPNDFRKAAQKLAREFSPTSSQFPDFEFDKPLSEPPQDSKAEPSGKPSRRKKNA